jgi:hypothetical protein
VKAARSPTNILGWHLCMHQRKHLRKRQSASHETHCGGICCTTHKCWLWALATQPMWMCLWPIHIMPICIVSNTLALETHHHNIFAQCLILMHRQPPSHKCLMVYRHMFTLRRMAYIMPNTLCCYHHRQICDEQRPQDHECTVPSVYV